LLNVAVKVLGILVQDETTKFLHGKLRAGPDFGNIERIEAKLLGIGVLWFHDLDHGGPLDFLASLDGLPEVALGVVGVFTAHPSGFFLRELLLAVLGDEVVFDVDKLALLVNLVMQLEKS
jgi:hypothetical protein